MSYLKSVSLTKTLPCLASPGRIVVIGSPSQPLNDVLPFLATLPSIIAWNPDNLTLTFRRQPGFITLYPDKVYITQVKDLAEGLKLLEALTDAINATWENRAELTAITERKKAPNHLDIWELLPRTNCGKCGEITCMAFAVGLLLRNRALIECSPLYSDPAFAERIATMQALL